CSQLHSMMVSKRQSDIPELDNEKIEFRSKSEENKSTFIPLEDAVKLVDEKVAYIVHSSMIQEYFTRAEFRKWLFSRYGDKCFYCGDVANTIDHIVPKSKGGLTSFSNCIPACHQCNQIKDNMDVENFLYYFKPSRVIMGLSKITTIRTELLDIINEVDKTQIYLNK